MLNTIKTETSKFQPSYGVPRRSVLDPPTPKPRSQSARMFPTSAARAKLHRSEARSNSGSGPPRGCLRPPYLHDNIDSHLLTAKKYADALVPTTFPQKSDIRIRHTREYAALLPFKINRPKPKFSRKFRASNSKTNRPKPEYSRIFRASTSKTNRLIYLFRMLRFQIHLKLV